METVSLSKERRTNGAIRGLGRPMREPKWVGRVGDRVGRRTGSTGGCGVGSRIKGRAGTRYANLRDEPSYDAKR